MCPASASTPETTRLVGAASDLKLSCDDKNLSTLSSFSSGSMLHVLYTSRPPGFTTEAAECKSSSCTEQEQYSLRQLNKVWVLNAQVSLICMASTSGMLLVLVPAENCQVAPLLA